MLEASVEILSVTEKTRKALQELGLTEYEMRGYLALLEHGAMTASRISEHSNVPYSKIYQVLGSLEKKGWIETENVRPSKYFPKPPTEASAATRIRIEDTFKASENQILKELQPLYEKKDTRERPDIWIIRGEYNILVKIRETITNTRRELLIATPILTEFIVSNLKPILSHLREIGVLISLMTNKNAETKTLNDLSHLADIRIRDQMFGGGVVSDSKQVVLLLGDEEKINLAIWADHVGLAKFAKNYFDFLWETSDVYHKLP